MHRYIEELTHEYDSKTAALQKKQEKLFNIKDIKKWENDDVNRMIVEDQKDLLKDRANLGLILPKEQQDLWRTR